MVFPKHLRVDEATYFSPLSLRKLWSSLRRLVAIVLSSVVNLFCHSVQWLRMAYLSGEQSSSTNWMFSMVSWVCTLLATSSYLQHEVQNERGEGVDL